MSRSDKVPAVVVERGEPPHRDSAEKTLVRARAPWRSLPMLWRVFAANATVLTLAFALLAIAPVKLHASIRLEELVLLLAGLVVMLVVDLVLLRHALGPLSRLSRVMGTIDLLRPGQRAVGFERSSSEVLALAKAFNEMLGRLEDERRESSARVLAAQEGERTRIARELHDEIGQTLTAVALRAEHAVALAGAERSDLEQLAAIVQHSLQEVRRIYRELRPEALDELGLRGALVALTGRVGEQGGIRVARDLAGELPDVSPDVELAIYRIAQEALTNAMRHSGASEVTVSLESTDGALTLMVADDGHGLPDDPAQGGGLTGMRERALLIGGELQIKSRTERGTVVTLAVPLEGDE
ncbi:MAG: sensor histidine kinase [Solirubrobacteraceae bacterium]